MRTVQWLAMLVSKNEVQRFAWKRRRVADFLDFRCCKPYEVLYKDDGRQVEKICLSII
jgi:hypothetical protein